jgi:enoyl-CoA hydratase/carnithine racemase
VGLRRPRRSAAFAEAPAGNRVVEVFRSGSVLEIRLNRPEVLNAYDRAMRDALFEVMELPYVDPEIRVVLVHGAGRSFSSGGDLSEFGTAPSPIGARGIRQARDVWKRWSELPCISIAAVHGYAAGGGLEMALLCDLILCSPDARFSLPETGLGLLPGVGGTQTLPRAVGQGLAAGMLLAGTELRGAAAVRCGLALEMVPRSKLLTRARRIAQQVGALDAALVRALRGCLWRGRDLSLADALRLEERYFRSLPASMGQRGRTS